VRSVKRLSVQLNRDERHREIAKDCCVALVEGEGGGEREMSGMFPGACVL
jgi:hypothetical protein